MKKTVKSLLIAMFVFALVACKEPQESHPSDTVINISAIQGVTIPVNGQNPITVITENAQYSGTVTWNGNPSVFAASTVYTATIKLTASTSFTLQGVAANFFKVAGAVSVSNAADSGVITAVFPATGATVINISTIQGITIPAKGGTPVTTITENEQYSGTVTWSPTISATFASATVYTATITLAPKSGYTLAGVTANFFKITGATSVINAVNSGVITAVFPDTDATVINIATINGVTIPKKGETPVITITENEQYSGTVTWSPTISTTFASATIYTATITLTPKRGYTLAGVTANFFKIAGAASSNVYNSGDITAVFPETEPAVISSVNIIITAPVKNATPVTTITENGQYSGTVSWMPNDSKFQGGKSYTATITLTAKSGYTFTGINSADIKINGNNAESSNNTGSAVTLSHRFAETDTRTVTNMTIKTQPAKLTYTHGDTLDMAGLVVTLTYDDTTIEDVAAANFTAKNITANPAHGVNLIHLTHNSTPVVITYGSLTRNTNNLTVDRLAPTTADFNISGTGTFTYDGNFKTVTITPKEGKSNGTRTIRYNGSITAPSAAGAYPVTFDVAVAGDFSAVSELSAGTLTIEKATPIVSDFIISGGTEAFYYDGNSKTVTVTPQMEKSDGARTVKYNGSTTAPSAVGIYTVTFDVAETTNFNAVNGFSAGTLTIERATPIVSDFNISGTGLSYYDGSPKTVTITPKSGKFTGDITVKYNGSTTAPSLVDTYTVTFDVAETTNFNAVNGLYAGTLTIINPFTSIAALNTYLQGKNANTSATPYIIVLNANDLGGDYKTLGSLGYVLNHNDTKYVSIDLSGNTFIWMQAFRGCRSLTGITIPDGVTNIQYGTFAGCTNLTSVTIPNSVTSIETEAFYKCSGLTSVTIGNSVTSIGQEAFSGCTNLTSVIIPDSVTNIWNNAFYGCSSLTSVTIGNSVTSIGKEAFTYCESLTSVTIGNSVTSIGTRAFAVCSGLTSVTIPNSVTSIGDYAFVACSGLTSVIIGNGVTSIESGAFDACSGLTSVTIPNSVTSIGNNAFSECTGLTSVTIPNSVTSIGANAFGSCTSLVSVTFATGSNIANASFGSNAFPENKGYNPSENTLKTAYATGKAGTYTRASGGTVWTKQ